MAFLPPDAEQLEAPRPFTPEELLHIAMGKRYFWYFLKYIYTLSFEGRQYLNDAGEWVPFTWSGVHLEWAVLAQFFPRLCVQAPRAHLKTTVLSQGYAFWQMFRSQDELKDILYFAYKKPLAEEKINDLKRYIRQNPYTRFWIDRKSTAETMIDYLIDWGDGPVAEARMQGEGIMAATRGRHPAVTICDDILSDWSNPLSSADLRLISRIFRQTIMALPANEDDPLILVGTPQSYDDILYELGGNAEWMWLLYPAIIDYKRKLVQWPEKYSFLRLMKIKKSRGVTAFEIEYQLTPVTFSDQYFTMDEVMQAVDAALKQWDLSTEFTNTDRLGVYAGFDVGKRVHPSHVIVGLELPDGTLVTLYEDFLDHRRYPDQVALLNKIAKTFRLSRGYYDSTYNVLDDRGLDRRWRGKPFTRKLKGDLATSLEKRLFAGPDEPGLVLPNDPRFLKQLTAVNKDLSSNETPEGHGDSFWSTGLMVRAAEDGPGIIDIGGPMTNIGPTTPTAARSTWIKQLGGGR